MGCLWNDLPFRRSCLLSSSSFEVGGLLYVTISSLHVVFCFRCCLCFSFVVFSLLGFLSFRGLIFQSRLFSSYCRFHFLWVLQIDRRFSFFLYFFLFVNNILTEVFLLFVIPQFHIDFLTFFLPVSSSCFMFDVVLFLIQIDFYWFIIPDLFVSYMLLL